MWTCQESIRAILKARDITTWRNSTFNVTEIIAMFLKYKVLMVTCEWKANIGEIRISYQFIVQALYARGRSITVSLSINQCFDH